jgi:hypothetical protein
MKLNTWWKKRNRRSKGSRVGANTVRPSLRRWSPPCLECLEDRTLLSSYGDQVAAALMPYLIAAQGSFANDLPGVDSLPVIGNPWSQFSLANVADALDSKISNLVDPSKPGLQQLPLEVDVPVQQVSFVLHPSSSYLDLQSLNQVTGQVNLTLTFRVVVAFTGDANAADPASTIQVASPTETVASDFAFEGVKWLPQTSMAASFDATIPGLTANGGLGSLLFVKARDAGTEFSASFGASPDSSGNFGSLTLQGEADARFHLDLYLIDPSVAGSTLNPHITSDFALTWNWDPTAGTDATRAASLGALSVSFNNVSLDASNIFPGLITDAIGDVQKITKPLQPFVNILRTNIPGLDDIGIKESLADLMGSGVSSLADTINFLNNLPSISGSGSIDLGSFSVTDPRQGSVVMGPSPSPIDGLDQAKKDSGGLDSLLNDFSFPLFTDPVNGVFQLFLGQNVPLVTFKANPAVDEPVNVHLPLNIGVFGLSLDVNLDLKFDLSAGYDTAGIHQAAVDLTNGTGDVATDLLHGFYVDNTNHATALDLSGNVTVNAGVLGLTIKGGVNANISFSINQTLNDPQGRVRLDQLFAQDSNPMCLFPGTGSVTTSLDLTYEIDVPFYGTVTLFDQNIANAVLVDLNTGCAPPTPLTPPDNTIYLAVTNNDEQIYVHNYELRVDNGFEEGYKDHGIEVDYGQRGSDKAQYREWYPVSRTSNVYPFTVTPLNSYNLIATDQTPTGGDHTILIDTNEYVYQGDTNHLYFIDNANHTLPGDMNGTPINVALRGGPPLPVPPVISYSSTTVVLAGPICLDTWTYLISGRPIRSLLANPIRCLLSLKARLLITHPI